MMLRTRRAEHSHSVTLLVSCSAHSIRTGKFLPDAQSQFQQGAEGTKTKSESSQTRQVNHTTRLLVICDSGLCFHTGQNQMSMQTEFSFGDDLSTRLVEHENSCESRE